MIPVENTKQLLTLMREGGMNRVKNDAINAKFTFIGTDYGVLAVGICLGQNLEEQN